jgi:hypothetical protein
LRPVVQKLDDALAAQEAHRKQTDGDGDSDNQTDRNGSDGSSNGNGQSSANDKARRADR